MHCSLSGSLGYVYVKVCSSNYVEALFVIPPADKTGIFREKRVFLCLDVDYVFFLVFLRLAKLFNQERNLCIQRRKCSSVCTSLKSTPRLPSSSPSVIENDMLKVETCSQNPEETFANQGNC